MQRRLLRLTILAALTTFSVGNDERVGEEWGSVSAVAAPRPWASSVEVLPVNVLDRAVITRIKAQFRNDEAIGDGELPLRKLLRRLLVIAGMGVLSIFALVGLLAVWRRRRSGAPLEASGDKLALPGGLPRRRHFLWIAIAFTLVAIYGSLVPLRYTPLDWSEAARRFAQIRYLSIGVASRADLVANILLFIPLGFFWTATLTVDRPVSLRFVWAGLAVLFACTALSLSLEFTQIWFPPRTVSQNDVIAETTGAFLGVAFWLSAGQAITHWLRGNTSDGRRKAQIDWFLEAYLVGLVVYSVLPLDLTISPAELADKFRQGKILLIPFAGTQFGYMTIYAMFRDVIVFVPVGMLAAIWATKPGRPVRTVAEAVCLGGLVVLAVELSQLFVYSRFTSTGDVVTGCLGVWLGAQIMCRWRGEKQFRGVATPSASLARHLLICASLVAVYCTFLLIVFCAPIDPISDSDAIRARFYRFLRVPFASLYRGSEYNAASEILKKLLFFAPLGALMVWSVAPLSLSAGVKRALLGLLLFAAAGVALTIEMAQVFLPPHVPDVTDVILCSCGAALGMIVAVRILGEPQASR